MNGSGRRPGQFWKDGLLLACLTAALIAAPMASAKSGPVAKPGVSGRLDPSFGEGGKVLVRNELVSASSGSGVEFEMTEAPGGQIVVASGRTVYRFLANGRRDRGFGRKGRIEIGEPAGYRFDPTAIAVDSIGRILVAGTGKPEQAVPQGDATAPPNPQPSWATINRYLPDGRRDLSFGNNGTVNSTLGLSPPAPYMQYSSPGAPPTEFKFDTPSVTVSSIAVDGEDRPLLAAASVTHYYLCYPFLGTTPTREVHLTRLSTDGALDQGFVGPSLSGFEAGKLFSSGGSLFLRSDGGTACSRAGEAPPSRIFRLDKAGAVDPSFGGGSIIPPTGGAPELAADLHGRIAIGTDVDRGSGEPIPLIAMLHPNGTAVAGFGEGGSALLPLNKSSTIQSIAVDVRGRPLLAGSAARHTLHPTSSFLLTRLTRNGEVDAAFGNRGFTTTRFGARSSSEADKVLLDPSGRILVGGPVRSPRFSGGSGFALARYLGAG